MLSQVAWLRSGGEEGFVALPEWRGELSRRGIRCRHCEAIRVDAVDQLDRVVVCRPLPECVAGSVSALWGGYVIRSDLAELIGVKKLERLCISVPLADPKDRELKNFRYYMERTPRGDWRGGPESQIGLCKECGRLMYWPVPRFYLLRRYWDGSDDATVICGEAVCTPAFAKAVVGSKQFSTLEATTRDLQDDPEDGLPAGFQEMMAEIRRRGWTK